MNKPTIRADERNKVIEEAVQRIEFKYGKKGTMTGSFGYQGIVMGITAYETPEDSMRNQIIELLKSLFPKG